MADLPVHRCNLEKCCDKSYHCPLCPKSKFRPGMARELRDHFQVHWKSRVEYKDNIIVSCNGNCRDRRSNRAFPHYHCPECCNIFQGKDNFESHLGKCIENMAAEPAVASPRRRGRPRKVHRPPDTTPPQEMEQQDETPDLEESPSQTEIPEPSPPRPVRETVRHGITSKERAIMTLAAESSDDEMEAFDKVTAVISKRIIASLAACTNVEDVLDDVAKNTGITWSWSPGTMEPVYIMSGDLIALVKAKRQLKRVKEEFERRALQEAKDDYELEPPLHFQDVAVSEPEVVAPPVYPPPPVIIISAPTPPSPPSQDIVDQEAPLSVAQEVPMSVVIQIEAQEETLNELEQGALQISAEEQVVVNASNTFEAIHGQTALAEDILQRAIVIVPEAGGIGNLPEVSVESIPQTTVGVLQDFADTLMETESTEIVIREQVETTQIPIVQLTENIFQSDFENNESSAVELTHADGIQETVGEAVGATKLEEEASVEQTPVEVVPPSVINISAELQEKLFEDQCAEEENKESEKPMDTSRSESEDKTVNEGTPSVIKTEVTEVNPTSEKVVRSYKKKSAVPITPVKRYSTRGVKMNFSELHSGKKQAVIDSSSDDEDYIEKSPVQKSGRGRGRPPGSCNRGRPPGSGKRGRPPGSGNRGRPPGSGDRGQTPGSGRKRGRPPKRGRGRPKKPRLERDGLEEVEVEEEEEESEETMEEDIEDSDDDPDFVVATKEETDGEDGDEVDEVELPEGAVRKKLYKLPLTPSEAHIASMPVIRFAGHVKQKENKVPEETALDVLLDSIKSEVVDPDYEYVPPKRGRPRGSGRGRRGQGRGRRSGSRKLNPHLDNFLLEEAFKQHPCLDCAFLADSFSGLTDHIIEVHNNRDHYRCDICEKGFNKKKHITHHVIMKHGPIAMADGQVYQHDTAENGKMCSVCGWESEIFYELTDHYIKEHLAYDVLRCDICEIVFKKARHRTTHLDNDHGPQNRKGTVVCDLCGHTCDKQRSLNWHKSYAHNMSNKKNPDVFYCRKCDFETTESNEFREHRRSHLEDRKWCDICQKSYSATTDMKTHMQAIHLKSRTCVCSVCDKTFSHWRYLSAHMERHTGEKKHLCNVCGQRFSKAAILREHIETHKVMSERNYKHICPYCDARYYSKDKYMDHLNKHTGEKPHICEECGKGFSFRSMLLKHKIYVHTTDRPFKCECCDKSFKFKQILKNHMVLHTGESRHVCEDCKKPFSCSATLKTHRPKCRGDQSWQKRKSGVAKAVANANQTTIVIPKHEYQELGQLQLHPDHIQQVQVDGTDLQQVHVSVSQPNLAQLVDTIVVEMGDGQRSIVDLNSLEAATQLTTEADNVATGIYLCSVCNAMFDTVNAAEEHIAQAHAPCKTEVDVDEVTEKLELEEVMEAEAEADANITNLISELETKVKAKLDTNMLVTQ